MIREHVIAIVGALLAVVLQVLVAPHMAVGAVVPNLVVVFTLQVAVVRSRTFGCLMPFIMGLCYDLLSGGALGSMAFSLTLFSVAAAWLFSAVDNDTLFMPIIVMVAGIFLVEFSYGVFMLILGYNAGLVEAFAYRIGPVFLYDSIIALITYPLARRLLPISTQQVRADVTTLR